MKVLARSPAPPRGFGGTFAVDHHERARFSTGSGPVSLLPRAVAAPARPEDVCRLVDWARSEGLPLISRGAGTGMPGGNVGPGVTVDLARHLTTMGPVVSDDRTVFAQPGVTLGTVETAARERGLFFPPLPSSADRCTVGGAVANNAAGARTFRHGSVRDWIAAVDVVLGDGRVVRLAEGEPGPAPFPALHDRLAAGGPAVLERWPRVRKNASGYGLDRFLPSGEGLSLVPSSEGTLGIVTGAVLKLAVWPEARALALLALEDLESLPAAVAGAEELGASACEFFARRFLRLLDPDVGAGLPIDVEAWLLIELDGSEERIRDGLGDLARLADHMGAGFHCARREEDVARLWSIRRGASPAIARAADRGYVSTQFIEDSVVPVAALPAYLARLDGILRDVEFDAVVFGHAGDGNVHVNPLVPPAEPDWRDRVRITLDRTAALVAELGGTLSGEHGDGRVRAPYLERIWSPAAVQAFRTVKATLDPSGILNPGVILPLPGQDPLEGLGAAWPASREAGR